MSQEEIFKRVIGYADVSTQFYDEILAPSRHKSFRSAYALTQAQKDELLSNARATEDKGLITDAHNFLKLLDAGEHYRKNREITLIKNVPWDSFDEEAVLDIIDNYIAGVKTEIEKSKLEASISTIAPLPSKVDGSPSKIKSELKQEDILDESSYGYAKKSLKAFDDIKFPAVPVKHRELKTMIVLFKNVLRSMNLEYLLKESFVRPSDDSMEYNRFVMDNKFLFSAVVGILSTPDHEAREYVMDEDIENDGRAAWLKLQEHYNSEAIHDNVVEMTYNK